ncbi:Hsp33 family molecular chaperone HslO [Shewanella surugensis]|uniref:33 kDa chaperonin n=1 Tax=Shewanella surugensis TaxID=212020 RepID=A0ABT0L8J1_9GAMM|nr:Hsp33 family molecular chaperone HslO [Shewanella surugensis]MCL1124021.1 Hsp33 family molecular chaperone HslO [Shewanella surugensis]
MNKDNLHRYLFESADVRGQIVQLEESYQAILAAHEYPTVIQSLLGQLMSATSLLTSTLKFQGDISVQLQGDGPVSLAVINGDVQQQLRGVARFEGPLGESDDLQQLFGKGHMVITLTPNKGERYQGVVALDKPTLSQCLEAYFSQSEQLPTKIWLFSNGQQAAGMLLQILPSEAKHNEAFEHLSVLTDTIKADELYALDAQTVLNRLYHEEDLRLFDPVSVSFSCRCSKERSAQAIRSVSKAEIDDIIKEQGKIEMGCEYCNTQYSFDSIDVEAIFSNQQYTENKQ